METLTLRAVRFSARRPQRLFTLRTASATSQLRSVRWTSTSTLVLDEREGFKRPLVTQATAVVDKKTVQERVVILGSGWGGYTISRHLSPAQYKPIVISPRSYFVFTPLLTDTAGGNLDFSNIVEPVRDKHVDYIQAAARSVDFKRKVVVCEATVVRSGVTESPRTDEHEPDFNEASVAKKGSEQQRKWEEGQLFEVPYDKLVISVGCVSKTFKTPGVRENAMFFKDIGDSKRVKRRVRECFELAVLPTTTPEMREYLLHFAIVGAGPTGTELAAALRDFIYTDMTRLYPTLKGIPKLTLYDVAPKVLSMFDDSLSRYAMETMTQDGIKIKTSHHVESLRWGPPGAPGPHEFDPKHCLTIKTKEEGEVGIGMCVWVTGNTMNKLISRSLGDISEFPSLSAVLRGGDDITPEVANAKWHVKKVPRIGALNVDGRFHVQLESEDGKTAVLKDVFAIGDNAVPETGAPPATAQATNQEAQWLAERLNNRDLQESSPFAFRHLGTLAYIGNQNALLQIPKGQADGRKSRVLPKGLTGRTAWLVWKFAYLSMSVSWRNKTRIGFRWIINHLFGRDISRY